MLSHENSLHPWRLLFFVLNHEISICYINRQGFLEKFFLELFHLYLLLQRRMLTFEKGGGFRFLQGLWKKRRGGVVVDRSLGHIHPSKK